MKKIIKKIIDIHKSFRIYDSAAEHLPRTGFILLSWVFSILVVFTNQNLDSITGGCTCLAFSMPILLEYYFKLNRTIDWKIRLFFTLFLLLSFASCVLSICVIINVVLIDDVWQWMFFLATLIVIPFLLDCIFLLIFGIVCYLWWGTTSS